MKRYRLLNVDFDSRAVILQTVISDDWESKVKTLWRANKQQVLEGLAQEFGPLDLDRKVADFTDMGPAPFSVVAWHNKFFRQIRVSFTAGAYYPALVASGSLGERILNHLVLTLRDSYRSTPQYKDVYRKQSFDDWSKPIAALDAWQVLQPKALAALQSLQGQRHAAVHFRPELDADARAPASTAIRTISSVIEHQFGAFGPLPWMLDAVPGETYIKKDWETHPFVERVYLPNCVLVGPRHTLERAGDGFRAVDDVAYRDIEIDDTEFAKQRRSMKAA